MTKKPKNPFWIRASYLTFISIMGLFLTLFSTLFLLLSTQTGLHIIVKGVEKFSSIPIQIEGAQGTILGPFTIKKIHLYNTIELKSLQGKWTNNQSRCNPKADRQHRG